MTRQAKVAIMGCGPGGSYLYSLLQRRKPQLEVILFDVPHHTDCRIKGCAWGVSWLQFAKLCREVGRCPEKYLLGKYDHVLIGRLRIKADVAIVDKPSLIRDLIAGTSPLSPSGVELDTFDRVVDATGAERAYLSSGLSLPVVDAAQTRIALEPPSYPMVFINSRGGYTWLFPLGVSEAHLGSLSPHGIEVAMQEMDRVRENIKSSQVICSCTGQIRCHGPVPPFTKGKIWGLGEAIGLVDPISGAGIVTAMTSAKLMAENWDSAPEYQRQVWHRYSYMAKEARAVTKLLAGEGLSYWEMFLSRRAFKTIGISPNFRQVVTAAAWARKQNSRSHFSSLGSTGRKIARQPSGVWEAASQGKGNLEHFA